LIGREILNCINGEIIKHFEKHELIMMMISPALSYNIQLVPELNLDVAGLQLNTRLTATPIRWTGALGIMKRDYSGSPVNHPGKETKNLKFFQRAQKILKTSRNTILELVITNIYLIF
jgi:hypothetical protein